jgi:hypothetical protein
MVGAYSLFVGGAFFGDFGVVVVHHEFDETLEGDLFVLELRSFLLTGGRQPRLQVGDPDSGICFVTVLTPLTTPSVRVYAKVFFAPRIL